MSGVVTGVLLTGSGLEAGGPSWSLVKRRVGSLGAARRDKVGDLEDETESRRRLVLLALFSIALSFFLPSYTYQMCEMEEVDSECVPCTANISLAILAQARARVLW